MLKGVEGHRRPRPSAGTPVTLLLPLYLATSAVHGGVTPRTVPVEARLELGPPRRRPVRGAGQPPGQRGPSERYPARSGPITTTLTQPGRRRGDRRLWSGSGRLGHGRDLLAGFKQPLPPAG